jgi:hypothetical protein
MDPREQEEDKKPIKGREIPIVRAHKVRDKMSRAIDAKKWRRVHKLAVKLSFLLAECARPDKCKIPHPHADGLFGIGWQRFLRAPDDVRVSLSWCNECISYFKTLKYSKRK